MDCGENDEKPKGKGMGKPGRGPPELASPESSKATGVKLARRLQDPSIRGVALDPSGHGGSLQFHAIRLLPFSGSLPLSARFPKVHRLLD